MSDNIMTAIWGAGQEELEKKAADERFIEKLASSYGVDIENLSNDQKDMLESGVVEELQARGMLDDESEKQASPQEFATEVMSHLQKLASGEEVAEEEPQIEVDEETQEALQALVDSGRTEAAEKLAQAYIYKTAADAGYTEEVEDEGQELTEEEFAAFDKLAEDRALEILEAAGHDPETGEEINDGSDNEAELDNALNIHALDKLAAAGWDVDELVEKVARMSPSEKEDYLEEKATAKKDTKKGDRRTYGGSRFLTSPITHGVGGGVTGGLFGTGAGLVSGGSTKSKVLKGVLGALAGGGTGVGLNAASRAIHARAQMGRARKGQGAMGKSERKVLRALRKDEA